MTLLGQASGGWSESHSALRILNAGISNAIGVLTDDAFTQTNPPIVTAAGTITAQVDQTLSGVLSGSVCFVRGDAGSNFVGGPAAIGTANVGILGIFVNSAAGNAFENTAAVASGKLTYMSGQGTYGNSLFEDKVLTGANAGNALTALAPAQELRASRNGYLTNAIAGDYALDVTEQLWEQFNIDNAATTVRNQGTVIGIVKMVPDSVMGEIVYDQRI